MALALVVLIVVCGVVTAFAIEEGRRSDLWVALGAIASLAQAIFVGIAILVAIRQIRANYDVAHYAQSHLTRSAIGALAYGEVAPMVELMDQTCAALFRLVEDAHDRELRRGIDDDIPDNIEAELAFLGARTAFVDARRKVGGPLKLLVFHCGPINDGLKTRIDSVAASLEELVDPPETLVVWSLSGGEALRDGFAEPKRGWDDVILELSENGVVAEPISAA